MAICDKKYVRSLVEGSLVNKAEFLETVASLLVSHKISKGRYIKNVNFAKTVA